MKLKILAFMIMIALLASAFGQTGGSTLDKVGTAGYQFLKIAQGARGLAMGDAYGPVADDASASFWVPAKLNSVKNFSVFFNHITYLADVQVDAIAAAKYVSGIGVFGLNMVYMNSGDIAETTVLEQNGTGRTFNSIAYAVGLSYARMLTTKFGIGGNIKYVNEDLTNGLGMDNSTGTWAVDIGTVYYPQFENFESLRLTMAVRDFGPEVQLSGTFRDYDDGKLLDEESEYALFPLPLNFTFGVALDPVNTDMHRLTVAVVGVHPNDNGERLNLGAEYAFREIFNLRGGYIVNHDTRSFSAGLGTALNLFDRAKIKLDYGYAHYGVLEDVQYLTLTFDW